MSFWPNCLWWQNGWHAVTQRVFFRNHNKQNLLPPPLGQFLVDYCFSRASWVGVQHWKGERRGWGQPGKGTVGNCFKLFLIWKSLKLGHLCHFGQTVSKNFVVNCGVANKRIWLFCVKAWFPVKWNFDNILLCFDLPRFTVVEGRRERQTSSYKTNFLVSGICIMLLLTAEPR